MKYKLFILFLLSAIWIWLFCARHPGAVTLSLNKSSCTKL